MQDGIHGECLVARKVTTTVAACYIGPAVTSHGGLLSFAATLFPLLPTACSAYHQLSTLNRHHSPRASIIRILAASHTDSCSSGSTGTPHRCTARADWPEEVVAGWEVGATDACLTAKMACLAASSAALSPLFTALLLRFLNLASTFSLSVVSLFAGPRAPIVCVSLLQSRPHYTIAPSVNSCAHLHLCEWDALCVA